MLRNRHLQVHRPAHSPTRSRLALVAVCGSRVHLFASPIYAATKVKPSSPDAAA